MRHSGGRGKRAWEGESYWLNLHSARVGWFLTFIWAREAVLYSTRGWASLTGTGVSMSQSGCRALLAPSFTSPSPGPWVPHTRWTGTYGRALPACLPQACTLARRNAEVFLKYIHRNNVSMPSAASHTRGPEQQVKGQCDTCRPPATTDKRLRPWSSFNLRFPGFSPG